MAAELAAACEPEVESAYEPTPAIKQESVSSETIHVHLGRHGQYGQYAREIMRITSESSPSSRSSDPIYDDDRSSRISRASRMSTRQQLQATTAPAKKACGFSLEKFRLSDRGSYSTQQRVLKRITRKQRRRTIQAETSFDTEWPSTMEGILTKDILQTGL